MSRETPFCVALTNDFYTAEGDLKFRDIGLGLLEADTGVRVRRMDAYLAELSPGQIADANGAIVLTSRVTANSLSAAHDFLAIGRFGVGYDSVDVAACTAADVLLYITQGAVDHSVAEATVGWMLALTHHVRAKDRLIREGRWDARTHWMGSELRDRTFGSIGCGGIARAALRLLSSFGMQPPLVYDPYVTASEVEKLGAQAVSLDELLANADFVSLHVPLTPETKGLLGQRELALMQPTAWLINTARGGIVDEAALYDALKRGVIAGAALDCFSDEPLREPPKLAELENVLFAPHSIAWTHELFRDIGRAACQGMIDLSRGQRPRGAINPEVFSRPGFQAKWKRLSS